MRPAGHEARGRATRSGAFAILLWASLAPLAQVTAALPPFEVLAFGFAVAAASGGVFLQLTGRGLAALRQPAGAFGLAASALFGYHALYLIAFRHAPPVDANLINYLWPPLIVVLAAVIWRERPGARGWAGLVLALAGVVVLVTRGRSIALDARYLPGYLAAAGAALTWSTYSVLNRRFAHVPSTALVASCAAVALLAAGTHAVAETFVMPSPLQGFALLLMGLGPTGAAFLLWDHGTKHGDLPLLGLMSNAAPVLSTLLLLAIGAQSPHVSQFVALALVVTGVVLGRR